MGNNCCGPRDQKVDPKEQQEIVTMPDFTSALSQVRDIEQNLTILVLGLDNAGKTSILKSLSKEALDSVKPTTGFTIKTQKFDNSTLNLKEVGGSDSVRPYW